MAKRLGVMVGLISVMALLVACGATSPPPAGGGDVANCVGDLRCEPACGAAHGYPRPHRDPPAHTHPRPTCSEDLDNHRTGDL